MRTLATLIVPVLVLYCSCRSEPQELLHPVATDIYGVEVELDLETGRLLLGPPVNLTDRNDYDNQPTFLDDGESFLYAAGDGKQVDSFRYDFATGQSQPLTRTPQREYSPTPIPGQDGLFSVVRVEDDASQRLWAFDRDGQNPFLLLEWEDDVGYHAWVDPELVVLRLQSKPPELRFAEPDLGWVEPHIIQRHVGRSLHKIPGRNAISYLLEEPGRAATIQELDLWTRESRTLAPAVENSSDLAWFPGGTVVMGQGAQLYGLNVERDETWTQIADYGDHQIQGISRIAVSPQGHRLVFVAERGGG